MVPEPGTVFQLSEATQRPVKIWICIPVFNRVEFTLQCLASLHDQTYRNFCVVVCDHGSTDGTGDKVRAAYPDAILLHEGSELWWTGAINRCIVYVMDRASQDDVVLTLNNDTELPDDYLENVVQCHERYPEAIITSVICDIATKRVVSTGYRQNWLTARSKEVDFASDHLPNDPCTASVTHASGRGTCFPVEVFLNNGLFDEVHLPHYGADYDFTHKARRAGWPVYVSRDCVVLSHVGATGMTSVRRGFSMKGLFRYLTDIKSPANLSVRWWVAVNNCPRLLLPSFIFLDYLFVVASYFKYHLLKISVGRGNA